MSGKIGSGKDLTGQIIQILCDNKKAFDTDEIIDQRFLDCKTWCEPSFHIRKFADKLKDIVCIILSCTREQLEDRKFKEKELREEWWYWSVYDGVENKPSYFSTKEEAQQRCLEVWGDDFETYIKLVKLTPRKFLQLLGTEAGRDIIHPNIWVNSLMSEYKEKFISSGIGNFHDPRPSYRSLGFPNWVITDTRFPNEFEAVKSRGGLCIKVERDNGTRAIDVNLHESETALDAHTFDYVIENNGTIKELVEKVKVILKKEKLI